MGEGGGGEEEAGSEPYLEIAGLECESMKVLHKSPDHFSEWNFCRPN